jgi:Transposase, Mutator family
MAEGHRMTAADLVDKLLASEHADVLRQSVAWLVAELMEAEVGELTGAELDERAPDRRQVQRNGYRPRRWDTRVGELELAIPKARPRSDSTWSGRSTRTQSSTEGPSTIPTTISSTTDGRRRPGKQTEQQRDGKGHDRHHHDAGQRELRHANLRRGLRARRRPGLGGRGETGTRPARRASAAAVRPGRQGQAELVEQPRPGQLPVEDGAALGQHGTAAATGERGQGPCQVDVPVPSQNDVSDGGSTGALFEGRLGDRD